MTATVTPIRPQLAAVTPLHRHPSTYAPEENPTGLPIAAAVLRERAVEKFKDARAIREGRIPVPHDGLTREQSALVCELIAVELTSIAWDLA